MFCDRCGTEGQPGQRFCSSCGKPIGVAAMPTPPVEGRVARHVTVLAVLWIAAGLLNVIGAFFLFLLGNAFGRLIHIPQMPQFHGFLEGLFSTIGALILVKALASFAAGWGLLERQPWARILTLILGFVSLLNIPLGTALGIYTIWVLLPVPADEEYRRLARAA